MYGFTRTVTVRPRRKLCTLKLSNIYYFPQIEYDDRAAATPMKATVAAAAKTAKPAPRDDDDADDVDIDAI